MKKVVMTGARGFIGRHTLTVLENAGYQVYPLALDLQQPQEALTQLRELAPWGFLHYAWETRPGLYWEEPSNLKWLQLSLDLLHCFIEVGGQRWVSAGSCAEKGSGSLYARCKETFQRKAAQNLQERQRSFLWGRIFFPYGPYEKRERLIPSLITSLLHERKFTCLSPSQLCDFIFVEDVAAAFVHLLSSRIEGVVDVGSTHLRPISELVTLVAEKLQKNHLILFEEKNQESVLPHVEATEIDWMETLGFQPHYSLYEGLDKTLNWWIHEIYSRY